MLASFIFVVLEEKEFNIKFLTRRSKCNHCSDTISKVALIPIFGFLYSKGKCRKCYGPIPFTYFYTELLLSVNSILNFLNFISLSTANFMEFYKSFNTVLLIEFNLY